jgi:hypothetical protein
MRSAGANIGVSVGPKASSSGHRIHIETDAVLA